MISDVLLVNGSVRVYQIVASILHKFATVTLIVRTEPMKVIHILYVMGSTIYFTY